MSRIMRSNLLMYSYFLENGFVSAKVIHAVSYKIFDFLHSRMIKLDLKIPSCHHNRREF